MRVAVEDKTWFSPSKIKMAVCGEHCLPVVKIPGSGECVYGPVAKKVCGVSLTSNRLEDRLKSEIMGSYREIGNVPVDGFEISEFCNWDAHPANRDPFFDAFPTSRKVLVRDPRGFVVGISTRCFRKFFPSVKSGKISGSLVYAWPATKWDVDEGPWLVPAGSEIAEKARAFSEAAERKEAFQDVSEMEVLGVYTAANGVDNGRKFVFLGVVPYEKPLAQIEAAILLEKKKSPARTRKKAVFALLSEDIAFLKLFSEDSASRTFLKAASEKIPAKLVPSVAKLAKVFSESLSCNPVDLKKATSQDYWEEFDCETFASNVGWENDGCRYRSVRAKIPVRARKLAGKPAMQIAYSSSEKSVTVDITEMHDIAGNLARRIDSSVDFHKSLERAEDETGVNQLARLLREATREYGLEQPDLGTKKPAAPEQLTWWNVFRTLKKSNPASTLSMWQIAAYAGSLARRYL